MYDEILEQASKFDAKFKEYRPGDLDEVIKKVAFDINAPHEDNHLRTPMTEVLIQELIAMGDAFIINKAMVQNIHYALFSGELEKPGIVPGTWRLNPAGFTTSDDVPPAPMHLDYLMGHFFQQIPKMSVTQMYRVFQTIHPFEDGNGRVGGVLLAVSSYNMLKGNKVAMMISPCQ